MRLPDPNTMRVNAALVPFTFATILQDGGEAFVVDAKGRTHFVLVDDDGKITQHLRYEGNPEVIVPNLTQSILSGEDLPLEDSTVTDML